MGVKTVFGFWEVLACFVLKNQATVFGGLFVWRGVSILSAVDFWSVVQTHPNADRIAVRNLLRQDVAVYNPVFSERIRGGYRRVQLFTNYIFVQCADRWRVVRNTVGVKDFLFGASDKPARLSDEVVQALRSRENANGVIVLPKAGKFRLGQEVSIRAQRGGEWLRGIYDGQSGADRAFVLLSMLGAQRRVELKEADLAEA